MSSIQLSKIAFRLGQASQMVTDLIKKIEATHESISDEFTKMLLQKAIKDLEEIENLIGMEMVEEMHSDD